MRQTPCAVGEAQGPQRRFGFSSLLEPLQGPLGLARGPMRIPLSSWFVFVLCLFRWSLAWFSLFQIRPVWIWCSLDLPRPSAPPQGSISSTFPRFPSLCLRWGGRLCALRLLFSAVSFCLLGFSLSVLNLGSLEGDSASRVPLFLSASQPLR